MNKHIHVLPMALACVSALQMLHLCAALDVTPEQFGAVGDGDHDDTQALRRAMASCSAVPRGPCHVLLARHYSSGPLRLNTSGITLNITGVLSMLPRDKYPSSPADQAEYGSFISTQPGIEDLTITGDGLITGLGREWWPCKYTGCWRPHLIVLSSVTGVKIGPLHMTDGPNHFIEVRAITMRPAPPMQLGCLQPLQPITSVGLYPVERTSDGMCAVGDRWTIVPTYEFDD